MYDIRDFRLLIREARQRGNLSQRVLATRAGTSQPAIASLEAGDSNPTIDTIVRVAEAAGFAVRVSLEPLPVHDPVVARYKQDVDRSLLRENLKKSVNERLRTLGEWQQDGQALANAVRHAKQSSKQSKGSSK